MSDEKRMTPFRLDELRDSRRCMANLWETPENASRRELLDALIAERTEVERLGKALELACGEIAYWDDCTLPAPTIRTDSGHQVDRPAAEFQRHFLTEADKLLVGEG